MGKLTVSVELGEKTGRSSDSEMLRNDKGLSETATPFAVNKGKVLWQKGKQVFFLPVLRIRIVQMDGAGPGCKEWNTFVEEVVDKKSGHTGKAESNSVRGKGTPLSQIEMTHDKRVSTDMKELDRVLGGEIVQVPWC